MTDLKGTLSVLAIVWPIATAVAQAQAQTPSVGGNSWVAIGVIAALVLIIMLFISGALSISRRDKSDDDDAGVGILEGIDEDDEKPRRR